MFLLFISKRSFRVLQKRWKPGKQNNNISSWYGREALSLILRKHMYFKCFKAAYNLDRSPSILRTTNFFIYTSLNDAAKP